MYWVVHENTAREPKHDALLDSLEKQGVRYSVHKVIPFSGDLIPETPWMIGQLVWCMGPLSMRHYARQKQWLPGVVHLDYFDMHVQLRHWKAKMLNWDAKTYHIERIAKDWSTHAALETVFVRPVDDSKLIAGQVMTNQDLFTWALNYTIEIGDPMAKVIVAPCKQLQLEARFWIVNGYIATHSTYRKHGQFSSKLHYDYNVPEVLCSAAAEIAWNARLDQFMPKAYCLDLCLTEDDEVKIIETNSINSCGLYDCNTDDLVKAIEAAF